MEAQTGAPSSGGRSQCAAIQPNPDQHAVIFHRNTTAPATRQCSSPGDGVFSKLPNARGSVCYGLGRACNSTLSGISWSSLNKIRSHAVLSWSTVSERHYYFGGTQDNGNVLAAPPTSQRLDHDTRRRWRQRAVNQAIPISFMPENHRPVDKEIHERRRVPSRAQPAALTETVIQLSCLNRSVCDESKSPAHAHIQRLTSGAALNGGN